MLLLPSSLIPTLVVTRAPIATSMARPTGRAATPSGSVAATVDELVGLVAKRGGPSSKTMEERARIRAAVEELENAGESQPNQLEDSRLFDNYEVAYFDRSVDGDRHAGYRNATRPFGLRSKVLGSLFSLRHSFQHVVRPNVVVNFVGFRFCGLPASVIARGTYQPLDAVTVAQLRAEHGTPLRDTTSVRITFDKPRVVVGPRGACLGFELGGASAQPPVELCTTYLDEKLRLGLAARGGRFVFTRGGAASVPQADEWAELLDARPVGLRGLGTTAALVAAYALLPQSRRALHAAALGVAAIGSVRVADARREQRRAARAAK